MSNSTNNWPVLDEGRYWLKQTPFTNATKRQNITEIHFVSELTADDEAQNPSSYAVDVDYAGEIKAYVFNDSVIKIKAEGSKKMKLNSSINSMFAHMPQLSALTGLDLLDASDVEDANGCFYQCGLQEIDLSFWRMDHLIRAAGMFNLCAELTNVKLPLYCTYFPLEYSTFYECPKLVHVDLGCGVRHIPAATFKGLAKLESVTGMEEVVSIGDSAFQNCTSLKLLRNMSDRITIGSKAFSGCTSLASVNILGSVSALGESAFEECAGLVEVGLGRGITVIPEKAFSKCLSLETVSGLNEVKEIGIKAFIYTTKLQNIDLRAEQIEKIDESAFRLSGIEDYFDFSATPSTATLGDKSIRRVRWDNEKLTNIQQYSFPEEKILLPVPNVGNQKDYDFIWGQSFDTAINGLRDVTIAEAGCSVFALYHEWQTVYAGITDSTDNKKQFDSFEEWWDEFFGESFVERNVVDGYIIGNLISELGGTWAMDDQLHVTSVDQLGVILNRLNPTNQVRRPTYIMMNSPNSKQAHTALIVGCTPDGKLAVLDSLLVDAKKSFEENIAYVRFEDIFDGNGPNDGDSKDSDLISPHFYGGSAE